MRDYFTISGRLHLQGQAEAWWLAGDGVSIEPDEASEGAPSAPVDTLLDLFAASAGSRLQVAIDRPTHDGPAVTMWMLKALAYAAGSATFHVSMASSVPRRQLLSELTELEQSPGSPKWNFSVLDTSRSIIPTRPDPESGVSTAYAWQTLSPESFKFALNNIAMWEQLIQEHPELATL